VCDPIDSIAVQATKEQLTFFQGFMGICVENFISNQNNALGADRRGEDHDFAKTCPKAVVRFSAT
jgi:hypothetical protein